MKNRKAEIATLLALGLIILGGVLAIGSSVFLSQQKTTSTRAAGRCGSGNHYNCEPLEGYDPAKCSQTNLEFACCVADQYQKDGTYRIRWYGCTGQYCRNTKINNTLGQLVGCAGYLGDGFYPLNESKTAVDFSQSSELTPTSTQLPTTPPQTDKCEPASNSKECKDDHPGWGFDSTTKRCCPPATPSPSTAVTPVPEPTLNICFEGICVPREGSGGKEYNYPERKFCWTYNTHAGNHDPTESFFYKYTNPCICLGSSFSTEREFCGGYVGETPSIPGVGCTSNNEHNCNEAGGVCGNNGGNKMSMYFFDINNNFWVQNPTLCEEQTLEKVKKWCECGSGDTVATPAPGATATTPAPTLKPFCPNPQIPHLPTGIFTVGLYNENGVGQDIDLADSVNAFIDINVRKALLTALTLNDVRSVLVNAISTGFLTGASTVLTNIAKGINTSGLNFITIKLSIYEREYPFLIIIRGPIDFVAIYTKITGAMGTKLNMIANYFVDGIIISICK